jgi:hypothetical protein
MEEGRQNEMVGGKGMGARQKLGRLGEQGGREVGREVGREETWANLG